MAPVALPSAPMMVTVGREAIVSKWNRSVSSRAEKSATGIGENRSFAGFLGDGASAELRGVDRENAYLRGGLLVSI